MSASWSWQDEQRLRSVVQVEDFPKPKAQPTEWDTGDGLGALKGMRNALPVVIVFWLFAGIALYLLSR